MKISNMRQINVSIPHICIFIVFLTNTLHTFLHVFQMKHIPKRISNLRQKKTILCSLLWHALFWWWDSKILFLMMSKRILSSILLFQWMYRTWSITFYIFIQSMMTERDFVDSLNRHTRHENHTRNVNAWDLYSWQRWTRKSQDDDAEL